MDFSERRRTVRVPMSPPGQMRLSRRVRVKVVDISGSGVLIRCDEPLQIGTPGRLRVVLRGAPCDGSVQIVRAHAHGDTPGLFGVAISGVDEVSRNALDRFLERAPE